MSQDHGQRRWRDLGANSKWNHCLKISRQSSNDPYEISGKKYGVSHWIFSDLDALGTMPNGNNPDCFLVHPIKEAIGADDDFSMG